MNDMRFEIRLADGTLLAHTSGADEAGARSRYEMFSGPIPAGATLIADSYQPLRGKSEPPLVRFRVKVEVRKLAPASNCKAGNCKACGDNVPLLASGYCYDCRGGR